MSLKGIQKHPLFSSFSRALIASLVILTLGVATHAAPRLMQGPMVGAASETSVKIWARTAGEHTVSIRYSASASFKDAIETPAIHSLSSEDYCVTQSIEGLQPGTYYHYQVLIDGEIHQASRQNNSYTVLTAPTVEMKPRFTIAFGAGAKVDEDGLQAIWLQVQNARPHAFFWLNENDSIDGLESQFQAEAYRNQRNVPFLQPLLRSVPQLAAWNGSLDDESISTFERYWANPRSSSESNRLTYFKYTYAGVDFFVLDTRSFAKDGKTLLGEPQLSWLKSELKASKAKFKILLSSKSWTNTPSDKKESWLNYEAERSALFEYIGAKEIAGVMLVSGSDEQAEINAIPLSQNGHYDLYEMTSSPLAKEPSLVTSYDAPNSIAIQEPYAESMNFGMLTFDMSSQDPSVSYEAINVFGESVFPEFQVHASELTHGTESWKSKQENTTLAYSR